MSTDTVMRFRDDNIVVNYRLDPQVKADWLKALRSGEYKQARGELGSAHSGYCCLGVLAELSPHPFNPTGAFPQREIGEWATGGTWVPHDAETAYTPGIFCPRVRRGDGLHTLSDLNDGLRLSFAEIADLIEEQL